MLHVECCAMLKCYKNLLQEASFMKVHSPFIFSIWWRIGEIATVVVETVCNLIKKNCWGEKEIVVEALVDRNILANEGLQYTVCGWNIM